MLSVKLICVGRLREKFYIEAFSEYTKRLNPYCRFECLEIPEVRLSDRPSEAEITAALDKEAERVVRSMPNWTPGKQNGQNVRVKYTLPITFRLQ